MRHTLNAIREAALMAWWDGSAIGLRLNCLIDIFDLTDAETDAAHQEQVGL